MAISSQDKMHDWQRRIIGWVARLYGWATERLYYELAWAYDPVSWVVSLGRWASWRRTALDYIVGQRILEVGFGTGELLIEMARRSLHPCGLDRSPAMHRVTSRKMHRHGIRAGRVCGITQKMPFADGSFDSIVSTFPAGYILHPATLQEVARLLHPPNPATATPGGRFIVVGLYGEADSQILRQATRILFGTAQETIRVRYDRIATEAGLRVTVLVRNDRGLRVPAIIAEKRG